MSRSTKKVQGRRSSRVSGTTPRRANVNQWRAPRHQRSGDSPFPRGAHRMRALAMLAAVLGALLPALAFGATFYVDNSLLTCNNNGPGTELQPYCTILVALMKQGGPGTTIVVNWLRLGFASESVEIGVKGS